MSFKAAILDLDGVIVNTVPLHFKAWKRMFSEYGKDITFEDYKNKIDGIPRVDGARAILTGLSEDMLSEAAAKKQEYFLNFLDKEGIMAYQSSIEFINKLKKDNIKVAVISSSKNCLYILKKANIDNLFDVIITGNDIEKGKPNPDVFLLAAKKLKVGSSESVVFEDAVLGVEAAKRADMKCIGVDRYKNPKRLKKADRVVGDLSEITINSLKGLFD